MEFPDVVKAMQSLNADDALRARLSLEQWRSVAMYLSRHEIRSGDLLVKQGDMDRTVYFLGQGTMQVYISGGTPGASKLAIMRPGSVIGEPGLFGDGPRSANVEAMTPCSVWALRGQRFEELAARQPALALELMRACGSVMAIRMRAMTTRQIAFT